MHLPDVFGVKNFDALQTRFEERKKQAEQYFAANPKARKLKRQSPTDNAVFRYKTQLFIQGPCLGVGREGVVKLLADLGALHKPLPQKSALFVIKRRLIPNAYYQDEYETLKHLGVNVVGHFHRPLLLEKLKTKCYIIEPYLGINLNEYLIAHSFLSTHKRLDIALQMILKLGQLHQKGLVHRDIKPENLLVDTQGIVHFIDFTHCTKNIEINKAAFIYGTAFFLPGQGIYRPVLKQCKTLESLDVFAAKRTLCNFAPYLSLLDLDTMDSVHQTVFQTENEIAACRRQDTALILAAHLLALKYKLVISAPISERLASAMVALKDDPHPQKTLRQLIESTQAPELSPLIKAPIIESNWMKRAIAYLVTTYRGYLQGQTQTMPITHWSHSPKQWIDLSPYLRQFIQLYPKQVTQTQLHHPRFLPLLFAHKGGYSLKRILLAYCDIDLLFQAKLSKRINHVPFTYPRKLNQLERFNVFSCFENQGIAALRAWSLVSLLGPRLKLQLNDKTEFKLTPGGISYLNSLYPKLDIEATSLPEQTQLKVQAYMIYLHYDLHEEDKACLKQIKGLTTEACQRLIEAFKKAPFQHAAEFKRFLQAEGRTGNIWSFFSANPRTAEPSFKTVKFA